LTSHTTQPLYTTTKLRTQLKQPDAGCRNYQLKKSRVLSIYIYVYGSTALGDLGRFFSLFIHTQSVGLLGKGISLSQGRYLHTEQQRHRLNAQTSMPRVGFELTIPIFERAKTVHALERAATVVGRALSNFNKIQQ
jgi:hypothetical protein